MAKNLTTFAPGMAGSVKLGMNDWYNEIVIPNSGCSRRCGPRNGDEGVSNHVWKFPDNTGYCGGGVAADPVSAAKIWMVNPGGGGAGSQCCGWGAPGASGAKVVFDVNLDVASSKRCVRMCTPNGGCCVASIGGQQGCRWGVLNADESQYMFRFSAANCGCWECFFYSNSKCNEVCYMGGSSTDIVRNWDTRATCAGSDKYYCAPESISNIADPQYFDRDSDVNMFKQQEGYAVAGCCYDNARNITMVWPLNHWCTTKAHYLGVKGGGYDCNNTGPTLWCGAFKTFGGTNLGLGGGGGLCEAGTGGTAAIAGAGNCYCGSPGGPGVYMVWYK
tara:strand:+ start:1456 stop:2451 length:996 start_codon:yes stop_codon:yes gene_type:complete